MKEVKFRLLKMIEQKWEIQNWNQSIDVAVDQILYWMLYVKPLVLR